MCPWALPRTRWAGNRFAALALPEVEARCGDAEPGGGTAALSLRSIAPNPVLCFRLVTRAAVAREASSSSNGVAAHAVLTALRNPGMPLDLDWVHESRF